MDRLYSPWRTGYINELRESDECIFCRISREKDKDELNKVLFRNNNLFIVMNKFPYSPGHLLIIPHMHVDSPEKLPREVWIDLCIATQKSCSLLYKFGAQGINMGMNVKSSAGAGIPLHLHMHVLPRWAGDTNFITAIGDTRVYGLDFDEIYKRMKELSAGIFDIS